MISDTGNPSTAGAAPLAGGGGGFSVFEGVVSTWFARKALAPRHQASDVYIIRTVTGFVTLTMWSTYVE